MKMKQRLKRLCALATSFLIGCQVVLSVPMNPVSANAGGQPEFWKDNDRNHRLSLNIDNSTGTEDLTDFPVLVRLHPTDLDYSLTGANDLRFYNSDQSLELNYEVEKWDPNDESIVWVKVPIIHGQSSTDRIWLYYGGSTVVDSQPKQVWDPNFLLVYHFPDRIEDYYDHPELVKQYKDSTANNNTGSRGIYGGAGPSYTLEGKDPLYNMVGRYYESHRGYVRATKGNVGDGEGQLTMSAWVRANQSEVSSLSYQVIGRKRSADTQNQAYYFKIQGGKWLANLFTGDSDTTKNGSTSVDMNGGAVNKEWTYLTMTYDSSQPGNNLKLYRDGVLVDSQSRSSALITTSGTATTPLTISKSSDASAAGGGYRGGVDEVRISKQARSAAWVQAEYANTKKGSTFVTIGAKETKGAMQLTLLQPKEGETYYTPDLSFGGMTSEVAAVSYSLDGQPSKMVTSAQSSFQTLLNGLKSGAHTLTVEAESIANPSVRDSKTVHFTISGSKLSPTAIPDGGSGTIVQKDGEVPLRVKAESPTGDPVKVSFYEKKEQFTKDFNVKSATNTIYDRTDTMDPPSSATISSEVAAPASAYDQLKAAGDGSYYASKSLSNYPYQRFDLTVDGDLSTVNQLDVTWKGHSKEQVMLYAWNYSTSKWVMLASKNGTPDNRDFELTGTLDKATMIHATTKVAKLYVVATQQDTMLPGQVPSKDQYDFSFVWMTDTQLEAESFPEVYDAETQWIADHKTDQKIQYVIHTGDIVNSAGVEKQWQNADHSMKILDDAGIPYGVIQGNHDMNNTLYGKYFGAFRFANKLYQGKPYYNPYNSWNQNHYDLISAGGVDFIILYMGWQGFNQTSVDWANQVLKQYKDRKAILAVHEYLLYSGTYGTDDYGGKNIMNQIVQPNTNVFMVVCGHNQSAYYNVKRIGGKVVYELLHDYQDAALGGAAYIRMMYFDLKNKLIYMVPYSPITNDNYGFFQQKHEFYTIPIRWDNEPIELATDYVGVKGSSINLLDTVDSTGTAQFNWQQLDFDKTYTWYAVSKDSNGNSTTTNESSFKLAKPAVQGLRISGLAPMKAGEKRTAVVEAVYTDGSTGAAQGYTLTSSSPAVAKVDPDGQVTAISQGETIISASIGPVTASYRLLVQAVPSTKPQLQSIQLDGLKPAFTGDVLQTVVTATYSDNSTLKLMGTGSGLLPGLTLTNSNPAVASLDAKSGQLTALTAGETVVSATYQSLTSSYTLQVQEKPAAKPELKQLFLQGPSSLKMGSKGKLEVNGQFGDSDKLIPIQSDVQFSSSFESIATVDETGTITPVKEGKTVLTARYSGKDASLEIEVQAKDPEPVVTPPVTKPSGGHSSGSGGGGAFVNPGGAPDAAFIQVVDASQLVTGKQDTATVKVGEEKMQVKVPYSLFDSMKTGKLELQFNWGTLVTSAHTPATENGKEDKNGTALDVSYHAIDDDAMDVIKDLQSRQSVFIKPASNVIQMTWGEGTGNNTSELHLPLDTELKSKRLGLYQMDSEGQLHLISPNRSNSAAEAVFTVPGNGSHIVLEYNVSYSDVRGHWASEVIGDLAARDLFKSMVAAPIIEGNAAEGFQPEKPITRAEFAALLARALSLPQTQGKSFNDIPKQAWYAQELAAAMQAGIVDGISDTEFAPDAQITREQMAAMLMRAWKVKNGNAELPKTAASFGDWNQISDWAKDTVASTVSLHLLEGRADKMFVPLGTSTRAEGAQAIHNYLFRN